MDQLEYIVRRLQQTIELEGIEPIDSLASYIIGDLPDLNDAALVTGINKESREVIQRIDSLASDIEDLQGTSGMRQIMWQEIKDLASQLGDSLQE